MAYLAGIDKGPVWTDWWQWLEHFRKWKKKVEILFKGPLNNAKIWSSATTLSTGLVRLVWISGQKGNWRQNRWWKPEQYQQVLWTFWRNIAPKSNALIIVVELKRLFQGSMSLEDFHTKALRLVKEAEYPEGDTSNRILRNTVINGLSSDKIHAKVIKEGKGVTLPRVIEIAQLDVSTQNILKGYRRLPR